MPRFPSSIAINKAIAFLDLESAIKCERVTPYGHRGEMLQHIFAKAMDLHVGPPASALGDDKKDYLVSAELAKEKLITELRADCGNTFMVQQVSKLIRNTDLTDCQQQPWPRDVSNGAVSDE